MRAKYLSAAFMTALLSLTPQIAQYQQYQLLDEKLM